MKIIDLTLTVSDEIPTFPGSPQPSFIPWENVKEDGYNLELLFLSTHTGTHMDAPYHFLEKGAKIHEISLKKLVSEAILIKSKKKSGGSITKTDIQKFEKNMEKLRVFLPLFSTQDGREIYKKNITLQKILDCQFQLQNILRPKRSIWLVLILQVLIWVQILNFLSIKSLQKKEC